MHVPEKWQMKDQAHMLNFAQQHSFAVMVSPTLQASHIPLVVDKTKGRLLAHVSRANPHWRELAEQKVLAIFSGAHAYISPNWYADSPAVPTWNYASVHITGKVTLLSGEETMSVIDQLMAKYEPSLLIDREVVTEEYQQRLSKGIVGFEIKIENIEGKMKLGQHRSKADQQGVVAGLTQENSLDCQALLAFMREVGSGMGLE
jgi:transcriptional regulator